MVRRLNSLIALALTLLAQGQSNGQLTSIVPSLGAPKSALPPGAIARLGETPFWHGETLRAVGVTPEGKTLITAGGGNEANEVYLWDFESGKLLRSLEHRWVADLDISKDGTRLAACGIDETISLWRLPDGKRLWMRADRKWDTPYTLAFTPDGRRLAVGMQAVEVLDADSGKTVLTIQRDPKASSVGAIAFSPDGTLLAAPDWFVVRLWDARSGQPVRAMEGTVGVNRLAFSPDGKQLFAGGYSREVKGVRVWNVESGKLVATLAGPQDEVSALAVSRDGKYLAAGGGSRAADRRRPIDHSITVWDLESGKALHTFPGHGHSIIGLRFMPDNRTLVSGCSAVRFWDVVTGQQLRQRQGHEDLVKAIRFDRSGRRLITAGLDGKICTWDPRGGKLLATITPFKTRARELTLSPDGALACGLGIDGEAMVVHTETGEVRCRAPVRLGYCPTFLPTADGLLLMDETGFARLSFRDPNALERLPVAGLYHTNLALDPTGRFLLAPRSVPASSIHFRGSLSLWDLSRPDPVRDHAVEEGDRYARVAISPDGRSLLVGDYGVVVIEAASGNERARIAPEARITSDLGFSPDGRTLAFARDDRLQLWNLAGPTLLKELRVPGQSISSVRWSGDGALLAAAMRDTTLLVWDMAQVLPPARSKPAPISREKADQLWDTLASPDARLAYGAICQLRAAGSLVVPLIAGRLKQVPFPGAREIDRHLAELDQEDFARRAKAMDALETLGPAVQRQVHAMMARGTSLETKRRLESLDRKLAGPLREPELLRIARAVEVLENVSTPEAQAALRDLAAGPAEHPATQEAQRSVDRLRK